MSTQLRSFLTASAISIALSTNAVKAEETVIPTTDYPVIGTKQDTNSPALTQKLFPDLQSCFNFYNFHLTNLKFQDLKDYRVSCISPNEQIAIEITDGHLTALNDLTTGEDKSSKFGANLTELRHY